MIVGIIFLFVSVLFLILGKAIADRVAEIELWQESIFSKFDKASFWGCKDYSWVRKDHKNKIIDWLLHNPLVFVTDIWHLANTVQRIGIYLIFLACWFIGEQSLLFYSIMVFIFVLVNVFGFHIVYHYLLKKRQ